RPRKRLAVHASKLVVKPDLQILRRYRRPLLLRLEHAHRSALEDHVHRASRVGQRRLLNVRIGISAPVTDSRFADLQRLVHQRQGYVHGCHGRKRPRPLKPGQVKQRGIGGYSALPALQQLRRDCRAERFFVALPPVGDLFVCAKDLFVEAMEGQLAPLHFWLTNRINIPTAINRASRVPTANERARFRRSSAFDPAPFCAAPRPNQKRRLPIEVSAVIGAALWKPHYAYGGYGDYSYSASAKSRNPGQAYPGHRRRERQRRG